MSSSDRSSFGAAWSFIAGPACSSPIACIAASWFALKRLDHQCALHVLGSRDQLLARGRELSARSRLRVPCEDGLDRIVLVSRCGQLAGRSQRGRDAACDPSEAIALTERDCGIRLQFVRGRSAQQAALRHRVCDDGH